MPRVSTQFENFNLAGFHSTQCEKLKTLRAYVHIMSLYHTELW